MSKYGDSAWVEKLAERRAVRDYYRDKFYADHGFAKRLKDVSEVEITPLSQLPTVSTEIEKSKAHLKGNDAAVLLLQLEMATTGLGLSLLPTVSVGRPSLQSMKISTLSAEFFTSTSGRIA